MQPANIAKTPSVQAAERRHAEQEQRLRAHHALEKALEESPCCVDAALHDDAEGPDHG